MVQRLFDWLKRPGVLCAAPPFSLFLAGFVGPLAIVLLFSFLPARTFGFHGTLTVDNYLQIVGDNYDRPFLWSVGLALATTAINIVVGYPIAYGIAKLFRRWAVPVMMLTILPLFIAENVRLFGWSMFLLKGGGVLAGTADLLFGLKTGTLLYLPGSVLFGLVYIYLPFTVFPMILGLSMVPNDQVEAARDFSASRWQIMWDIEVPIAMPGILIGWLLTFVLALGAISEAQILGAEAVPVIAGTIQRAFTYAQNWPLGSALSMLVILVTAVLVYFVMRRVDLDRLMQRR